MCDCEAPSTYHEHERKARKVHKCYECGDAISAGDRYQYISGVWNGSGMSFKVCLQCSKVKKWYIAECLTRYDCAPCIGGLYEDIWGAGNKGSVTDFAHAAQAAGYL